MPSYAADFSNPLEIYAPVFHFMGAAWSSPVIDGLGLSFDLPCQPTRESKQRLERLLQGSVTSYRPTTNKINIHLISAFFLGATPAQLIALYETESQVAEAWPEDDPIADSIGFDTLPQFFGKDEVEGRIFEYFRDCLTESYDWPDVVREHAELLLPRLRGTGDWYPLISLAHAVEVENSLAVIGALTVAAATEVPHDNTEIVVEDDQEIEIQQLVRAAAQRPPLAVAAQAMCELLLPSKFELINPHSRQRLLGMLKRDIERAPIAAVSDTAAEFLPEWEDLIRESLENTTKVCLTRAALFTSLFLKGDFRAYI